MDPIHGRQHSAEPRGNTQTSRRPPLHPDDLLSLATGKFSREEKVQYTVWHFQQLSLNPEVVICPEVSIFQTTVTEIF